MTWPEYMAARQLLAEEQVGRHVRAEQAAEDAKVQSLRKVATSGRPR